MINFKALFLDIDGTVITPDDRIEESTKSAIEQVQNQGVEVFLATGRPIHEIDYLAKQLNIHSFVGYNGAFAIYKDKEIVKETMDPTVVEQFAEVARKSGHEMLLFTSNRNLFLSLESPIAKHLIDILHFQNNGELTPDDYADILSMSIINLGENDLELYQTKEDIRLSPIHSTGLRHDYDVIRQEVNKGQAILKVLQHLHIPAENAIAFGDGMNDKEMLSVVGEGFAMGNAHPLLFEHAKHRTTEVTNSGIFNGLKSLGLVK